MKSIPGFFSSSLVSSVFAPMECDQHLSRPRKKEEEEKSPVREDFSRSPPKSQRRRRSFTSEGRFHLSSKEKKQKRFSLSPKSRECCFLFCLFAKNSFSLLQSTPSHSGPLAAVGSIKRQNFGGPPFLLPLDGQCKEAAALLIVAIKSL